MAPNMTTVKKECSSGTSDQDSDEQRQYQTDSLSSAYQGTSTVNEDLTAVYIKQEYEDTNCEEENSEVDGYKLRNVNDFQVTVSNYDMQSERIRVLLNDESEDIESEDVIKDSDSEESDHLIETDTSFADSTSDIDEHDDELYYIGKDKITKWQKTPPKKNVNTQKIIVTELPGVKQSARKLRYSHECFSLFIDSNIVEKITKYTNIKIEKDAERNNRQFFAYRTDVGEMKAFIGLLILVGALKSSCHNLTDLWDVHKTSNNIFHVTMNLKRFQFLLQYIQFDDVTTRVDCKVTDKLAPIREIFDLFITNCKMTYSVSEHCTVGEQLVIFHSGCSFQQYIPKKSAKCGIRIYALTDARTWYTLSMEICAGAQPEGPFKTSNNATDIVIRLTEPIHGTGRNITGNNSFTSYPLVQKLLEKNLTYIGTVRKNKVEIPYNFIRKRTTKSSLCGFQKQATLLSYIPENNMNVLLLSTMRLRDDSLDEVCASDKPNMIKYYNLTKGSVGVVDDLCSSYSTSRKCRRWTLTIFSRLLDIAGINSFVIHSGNNPESKMKRMDFLVQIGFSFVNEYIKNRTVMNSIPKEIHHTAKRCRIEIEGIPVTKIDMTRKSRCTVCGRKKDIKTKSFCHMCMKYMCLNHMKTVCSSCFSNCTSCKMHS